jgi:glycosyltransferase involved in cell wall biosynthesis
MRTTASRLRVIGLPASGHAYQDCFYAALRAHGVEVLPGYFAGRWLLANVHRGDVLHLHWLSFCYASESRWRSIQRLCKYIAILLLMRSKGARIAWTAHNLCPHQPTSPAGIDWIAHRVTIALATRIFAHGPSAMKIISSQLHVRPTKLRCIPHGHWVNYFCSRSDRASAREHLGISPDARMLLFFGGAEPYKNLPLLLRAFAQAQQPGEQLWIVGRFKDADYHDEICALAAATPMVHIVDRYVKDEEIHYFMHAANIAVLPFREILTSGATMLALSYGVPVIAPRMGFLTDVIDAHSGLLYSPAEDRGDTGPLIAAMQAARTKTFDPAVIRAHALEFRWEDAAEQFIQALR